MSDDPAPIARGRPWGTPFHGDADLEVAGDDRQLAAAVARHPGARVRFRPSPRSQLARAVGLGGPRPGAGGSRAPAWSLPVDAIEVVSPPPGSDVGAPGSDGPGAAPGSGLAVNAVVVGTPPARLRWWSGARPVVVRADGRPVHSGPATTVVVANGQYLGGIDAVPRGHPGDGRLEVQVYALRRGERAALRRRLPAGAHLPHPRLVTSGARRVEIEVPGRWRAEIDGVPTTVGGTVRLGVRPGAFHLVVGADGVPPGDREAPSTPA